MGEIRYDAHMSDGAIERDGERVHPDEGLEPERLSGEELGRRAEERAARVAAVTDLARRDGEQAVVEAGSEGPDPELETEDEQSRRLLQEYHQREVERERRRFLGIEEDDDFFPGMQYP